MARLDMTTGMGDHHPDWPELQRVGVRPPLRQYLIETWKWQPFIITIAKSELRVQHQNTMLGQLWHLLNPLLLAAVYYFVFGIIVDINRGQVDNYVAFLIVGIFVFTFTQKAMQTGARIIIKNQPLLQTLNFPRAVLPASGLVGETLSHLPAIGTMCVLLLLTGESIRWTWLLIVPALLLQVVFTGGLVCCAARLAFHFRDVQQLLPYVLRLWFYMSGILFSVEVIGNDGLKTLLQLNPMNAFVTIFRDATMSGSFEPFSWAIALVSSLCVAIVGFWYFRQAETEYASG